MKQGRLPFTPVDPKIPKKRKLSAAEDKSSKSPKLLCSDEEISASRRKSETFSPLHKSQNKGNKVLKEKENVQTNVSRSKQAEDLAAEGSKEVPSHSSFSLEDSKDGIEILSVKRQDKCQKVTVKTTKKEFHKGEKGGCFRKRAKKVAELRKDTHTKLKKKRKRKNVSSKQLPINNSIDEMFKSIKERQNEATKKNKVASCSIHSSDDIEIMDIDDSSSEEEVTLKEEAAIKLSECWEKSHNTKKVYKKTLKVKLGKISGLISNSFSSSSTLDSSLSLSHGENCSSEVDGKEEVILLSSTQSLSLAGPSTSARKSLLSVKKRKLTVAQWQKQVEMRRRKEEQIQQQIEKKKLKQAKEEERQKLKEEKKKKKLEKQEVKKKEKEEKCQKREVERLKKEEEKQKKEEKKEEERLLAEQELKDKQQKRKAKFAQFFVPKRMETSTQQKEGENAPSNFILFQVKDNMKVAPLVRSSLSIEKREMLEAIFRNSSILSTSVNYLQEIATDDYIKGRSYKTFPTVELDDDCEILSEDDDSEDIDGTDLLQESKALQPKSKQRVKLFQFCENSRPAYYGTWSKKPAHVTGRRPFVKEEVFDYDYDSDEDWEEVENGESLSDSDGDADGEEGGEEDYEVDNDFFVPHGYLSDGEGEEREDEEESKHGIDEEEAKSRKKRLKDEDIQKEKLKQKQEEFELEMKQKTKQLKPKVYGCIWLEDQSSHPAYDQLVKILSLHRATVMFGSCPLGVEPRKTQYHEAKDQGEDEEESSKKFVKSFPEKAVADLIRLIHGNRYSKLFLVREFSEYWKRRQSEASDEDAAPLVGCIAKRKIEPKIQEIAQYGRFSEDELSHKYRIWYVSKEVRKKYGLEDLSLRNMWTYTLTPKEWGKEEVSGKEVKAEESTGNDQQTPKGTNTSLITKFTKVLSKEEERKNMIPISSSGKQISVVAGCSEDSSPSHVAKTPKIPQTDLNQSKFRTPQIPVGGVASSKNSASTPLGNFSKSTKKATAKKKIVLSPVLKKGGRSNSPKSSPIATLFKNIEKDKEKSAGNHPDDENASDFECITVD